MSRGNLRRISKINIFQLGQLFTLVCSCGCTTVENVPIVTQSAFKTGSIRLGKLTVVEMRSAEQRVYKIAPIYTCLFVLVKPVLLPTFCAAVRIRTCARAFVRTATSCGLISPSAAPTSTMRSVGLDFDCGSCRTLSGVCFGTTRHGRCSNCTQASLPHQSMQSDVIKF